MEKETPNIRYGQLREAVVHYGFSAGRAVAELDWLLDEDRWKEVGSGFDDIDDFLKTISLSDFKFSIEQRKGIAKKLEAIHASQRATAEALGVSTMTVNRDVTNVTELENIDTDNQDIAKSNITNVTEPIEEAEVIEPLPDYEKKIGSELKSEERQKEKQQEKELKEKLATEIKNDKSIYVQDIDKGWHKLGNQFLYYGSNLDNEFIDFLPDCKFGFADPPYNAGVDEWDSNFNWQQDSFIDKCEVMAVTPGGWEAFNFYNKTEMPYMWELICYITNGMTHGKCGFSNHIKASIFSKNKVKIPQDLFTISIKINETEDTLHKGRKPYLFMIELINMFSKEGDYIFDLFAGSGTTLLISEKLKRISYNAEIDMQSCINIVNRAVENNIQNYGKQ